MSNDEQKNFIHFYILHIKNEWFLLELEMALVTTFEIKFALVWLKYFLKAHFDYIHTCIYGRLWQPIFLPFGHGFYLEWQMTFFQPIFSPTSFFLLSSLSDHLNKKWNDLVIVLCVLQNLGWNIFWMSISILSILFVCSFDTQDFCSANSIVLLSTLLSLCSQSIFKRFMLFQA